MLVTTDTGRRNMPGKWSLPPKGGHMDKRTGVYLQTMTMRDIEERLKTNDVLIVPLGATEAHGPNAPIGEDIFLVTRMAEAVAERTGCTVSEPLWWGSHPYHHLGMPSTVVIPEEIFTGFLRAMIAGFWNMGFRKQILLNGHGQEYVIPTAIHQFGKRYRVPALVINLNWYHAVPDHFKLKSQGGPYETPFIHADEVESSFARTAEAGVGAGQPPVRLPARGPGEQSRHPFAAPPQLVRSRRRGADRKKSVHRGGGRQALAGKGGKEEGKAHTKRNPPV